MFGLHTCSHASGPSNMIDGIIDGTHTRAIDHSRTSPQKKGIRAGCGSRKKTSIVGTSLRIWPEIASIDCAQRLKPAVGERPRCQRKRIPKGSFDFALPTSISRLRATTNRIAYTHWETYILPVTMLSASEDSRNVRHDLGLPQHQPSILTNSGV